MKKIQYAFLDSGIGGLPYLNYLKQLRPNASCAYIADIKHFPYGEKSLDEVIEFSNSIVKKIIHKIDPALIIIACNTISVSALDHLRKQFNIPFVGTVPAIKPASLSSKNKKIAILATERTINDIYTQNLIQKFGSDCEFFLKPDPLLIKHIEETLFCSTPSSKNTLEFNKKMIEPAVNFFKDNKVDIAVLACTHFLHLQKEFIEECEPNIKIVDSLNGVVQQAIKVYDRLNASLDFKSVEKPTHSDKISFSEKKDTFFITEKKELKKYQQYSMLFNLDLDILN